MQTIIDIQKKIVPDLLDILQKRYEILQSIRLSQPVGRRVLAQSLGFTERTLRAEVDFLKAQRLIDYRTTGMILTEEGTSILGELEELMSSIKGIHTMEENLKKQFKLDEVTIVHGDSDQSSWVKKELGKACANSIKQRLLANNIIAVTGGTTTLEAAEAMTVDFAGEKDVVFVPARGGLGEDLLNQANSIVAKMAANTGSKHKLLYAPDQISRETHESILKEPTIKEVLQLIKSSTLVLHGIGEAITMAQRRNTSEQEFQKIKEGNAIAEAFGYYFNEEGQIVHRVSTIGLQLDDLSSAHDVIAVAGGASKGKAIRSYLRGAPKITVLITDEAAAEQLLAEN